MERPGLTSVLLFCATDAGGARNIAPVAALALARGVPVRVLASASTLPLFAEAGVPAEDGADSDAWPRAGRPAAVICGTARPGAAETAITEAACRHGVRCLTVLDEWYGYRLRFTRTDSSPAPLPDLICCPDEAAVDGARAEGLPPDRLVATGSPALAATADRIAAMATDPPPLPEAWDPFPQGQRLLFLSETHAADYGDGVGQRGPLGPWLGYSERDVRRDLSAAAGTTWGVVEKLHPSDASKPDPAAPRWRSVARVPLWPLLWHADRVVGMRSMALLEAAMMGHRPLSFQPNLRGSDDCAAARLRLADRARTAAELAAWLATAVPGRCAPVRPACADADAARRILDCALSNRRPNEIRP